jgi:hypothetical protein
MSANVSPLRAILSLALLAALAACPPTGATPTPRADAGTTTPTAVAPHPPFMFPGPGATLQWTQYLTTTTFTVPFNVKGYLACGCGSGGGGAGGEPGVNTGSVTSRSSSSWRSTSVDRERRAHN